MKKLKIVKRIIYDTLRATGNIAWGIFSQFNSDYVNFIYYLIHLAFINRLATLACVYILTP